MYILSGVDEINVKILKNTKCIVPAYLSLLFTQSLSLGLIPDDWRVGKVVPVHESGDKDSPLNYRPISLTSIPCKIMEHVIYSLIMKFFDSNSLFHPAQHGFHKGLSCEMQLAIFLHDIHTNLDINVQTDVIFLDFCKAFDKVPHQRLLFNLKKHYLHPDVFKWITEFLSNHSQFVAINNYLSNPVLVTSGIPQGSVLGPLVFLIYINDLPSHVSSNIRMFADDCVIYRAIFDSHNQTALQKDLDNITTWCNDWLMTLNTNKCKAMSFSYSSHPIAPSYKTKNTFLENVHSYKYLGITLSNDLSWHTHISNIISSANRRLGFLRRNLRQAPKHVKLLAYQSLVRPTLEYASAIWNPHQSYLIDLLETVQNRATRFIHSKYSYNISISAL